MGFKNCKYGCIDWPIRYQCTAHVGKGLVIELSHTCRDSNDRYCLWALCTANMAV